MANSDEDEGWQTVKGKKKRHTPTRKIDVAGKWKDNGERTNNFYFSKTPNTHGAREMLKAFAYYGEVVEVVIPFKRNNRGLRFGFTRFRNVTDPRTFVVKLGKETKCRQEDQVWDMRMGR